MRIYLFLCVFPLFLNAQSSFLKDPDIVWATRLEQDWVVENNDLNLELDYGVTTLKLLRTENNAASWYPPYLSAFVLEAVKSGRLPVYSDPECTIPANVWKVIALTDTVVTYDPETYEANLNIYRNEILPYDIKGWRVRQIAKYHKKSAVWSTEIEAIAPFITRSIPDQDSAQNIPLFWFKGDNSHPDILKNNVVWAKMIKSRMAHNQINIPEALPFKVSKGFSNPATAQFEVLKTVEKIPFYNYFSGRQMTMNERHKIENICDSLITFNPETYEENVYVQCFTLNPTMLHRIGLSQNWYWDEKKSRLSIVLNGTFVLLDRYDEKGDFIFSSGLFYRSAAK